MSINVVGGKVPPYQPLIEPRFEVLRLFTTAKTVERVLADVDVLLLIPADEIQRHIDAFLADGWISVVTRPKGRLRCTAEGLEQMAAYQGRREQHRIAQMNVDRAKHFREKQAKARELGGRLKYYTCNDGYVCDVCRSYTKQTYAPDEAPPLPHADCTSELDECRCWVSVHLED